MTLYKFSDVTLSVYLNYEQGNRHRYQTSPMVCNSTANSIYFLNLNPIKAKLTLLSYVHQYIYLFIPQRTPLSL